MHITRFPLIIWSADAAVKSRLAPAPYNSQCTQLVIRKSCMLYACIRVVSLSIQDVRRKFAAE